MPDTSQQIGGNFPPEPIDPLDDIDPEFLVDPAIIPSVLRRNYGALAERSEELAAGIQRMLALLTPVAADKPRIENDVQAGEVADYVKQINGFVGASGEVETARKRVKEPLLDAGRLVDDYFKNSIAGPVCTAMLAANACTTAYIRERAEREEKARRTEVERLAAEAHALAEQAAQTHNAIRAEELTQRALEAEQAARDAQHRHTDPRVRGDLGAVMSARRPWKAEVTDLMALVQAVAAGKAPLHYLCAAMPAINAAVRSQGVREIAGVRVFQDITAGVR